MQIKQAGTHVDMNPEACPHAPPPRLQIPPVWNDEAQISRMLVAQQAMIPSREPRPTLEPRLFTCGPWTAEPYVPRQRRSFISAPPEPDFKDPPPAAPRFILPSQPFPVRDRSDSDQSSAVSPTTRSHSREWDSTPTTACGSPYGEQPTVSFKRRSESTLDPEPRFRSVRPRYNENAINPETGEMVYDWEGKEVVCYKMYIEEKKSLEEIMDFFKLTQNFTPSKRAFQSQFSKKWHFPSKQNIARSNEDLVARVGELWKVNTSQKEMMQILVREGFTLTERSLTRVRKENQWTLRSRGGMKPQGVVASHQSVSNSPEFEVPEISAELVATRNQNFQNLQIESEKRLKDRTRRVRTVGWAGLGPDPPMEPRFPSEMTIHQSRDQLRLDLSNYQLMRDQFQDMCEVEGIVRKTLAGAERWQKVKDKLVQQSPFLQAVLCDENTTDVAPAVLKKRCKALDIICSDVTKKIRTSRRRVSIPDAKSVLGINPAQSSEITKQYYRILMANHFTSKIEAGPHQWEVLKQELVAGSSILKEILKSDGSPDSDIELDKKKKALEVVCRDVMKRLRDDQTKRVKALKNAPQKNASHDSGIDDGVATDVDQLVDDQVSLNHQRPVGNEPSFSEQPLIANQASSGRAIGIPTSQAHPNHSATDDYSGMEIDPSLLNITSGHPVLTYGSHLALQENQSPAALEKPMFMRVSTTSPAYIQPSVWMSTMPRLPTISALLALAHAKHAPSGAHVVKMEAQTRSVNLLTIDRDDELEVFLDVAQGETPTFIFHFASTM